MALALAFLIGMLAPSLLTASGDSLDGADEALDEALSEPAEDGEDAVQGAVGVVDETIDAAPGIASSAPPAPEPDPGASAGDREGRDGPAAEPKGKRSRSGERRSAPTARAAGSGSVDIRNFAYSPREITVRVGDAVRWMNQDRDPHDAEAFDGSFKTRVLQRGESDSVTFSSAGSFRYFCSIHPPSQPQWSDFTGTVRVLAAEDGGGAGGGDDSASAGGGAGAGSASGGGTGAARSSDRGAAGSGLPVTGLPLIPLIALGLALISTGALFRRFRSTN